MPKDYAKRQPQKAPRSLFKSMTFWAVLLAIAVVSVMYGIRYFHHDGTSDQTLPPVREAAEVPVFSGNRVGEEKRQEVQAQPQKTTPIKYEFYSMLPKTTVEEPEPAAVIEPKIDHVPTEENQPGYWLQIGAYYTEDAASDYQSRVQLLGLDADIVKTPAKDKDSHDIYRVEIGPLDTYQEAKQKQQELTQMKLDSLIRKV